MRIVELSDYTMVIMKDSDDPPWRSVGKIAYMAEGYGSIIVDVEQITVNYITASDFVCSAGKLVLFFKDKIPDKFHLHDKVSVAVV